MYINTPCPKCRRDGPGDGSPWTPIRDYIEQERQRRAEKANQEAKRLGSVVGGIQSANLNVQLEMKRLELQILEARIRLMELEAEAKKDE